MRKRKRKISEVIWRALVFAKDDRLALIDAYNGDETVKAVRDAKLDIDFFDALQLKLFGTNKTKLDALMANAQSMDILKMITGGQEIETDG